MLLEAQLNTRALAGAFAENIKSGFMGEGLEEDELEAAHRWGCNQYKCMPGCLNGKGTSRENKDKNVNNTPKLAPKNAKTNEIEKALKDGIEWVLKHRKPLYEVCYVPSLNEEGEEELVPLDLHLKDILHASEHNDTAKEIWKIIARSKLSLRDNNTDEVYRYGRKKAVLRDYLKNNEKRKRIVTIYKDNREDKTRKEKSPQQD